MHVILSFDSFHTKCRKFIQDARSTKLSKRAFVPALPPDIFAQRFIKRLIEIDAMDPSETDYAVQLTTIKLQLALHLDHWEQTGEVTSNDIAKLHEEVQLAWQNKFRHSYLGCEDKDIEKNGRDILHDMISKRFPLAEDELPLLHSNGEVYQLSDDGHIGWHKYWRTK